MEIKFKQGLAGPAYSYNPGDVADMEESQAIRLCEKGIAEPVKDKKVETQTAPEPEKEMITFDDLEKKAGGWYEFPNGEKVRGEEKAKKKLKEMNGG